MPGPKNKELGIRSSKVLRGGIDFPEWEGINRQNDPGAIRDTQLYSGVNIRLNGNEIQNRGGQTKIHTVALTGAVYGFIEAPGGSASLLLVNDSDGSGARLSRYYSGATPKLNSIFPNPFAGAIPQTLQSIVLNFAEDGEPRRALVRYSGRAYQFGKRTDSGGTPTLFQIILPQRTTSVSGVNSFQNQVKLQAVASIPEFSSAVTRQERYSDSVLAEVMYIGSVTTGDVYRWDGSVVSTEDSNLASTRHIMAIYKEDVYAIANNAMRQRNGGLWDINTALGIGVGSVPTAAFQYLDKLFIGFASGIVLSWDGTTVTDHTAAIDAALGALNFGDTLTSVTDIKVFNGLVYFIVGSTLPTVTLVTYNNSAFVLGPTLLDDIGGLGVFPGCLEPSGNTLWFTLILGAPESTNFPRLFYTQGGTTATFVVATPNSLTTDMIAF